MKTKETKRYKILSVMQWSGYPKIFKIFDEKQQKIIIANEEKNK